MQTQTVFSYSLFIPFHLSDGAGILFFGHVFALAHQGFEQFVMQQLKCPWENWFQNPDWCVPIKQAEANYLHPVRAGQECRLDIALESIGSTSFSIASSLFQGRHCCTVKTVHVFCHSQTKQKMPIPPFILNRLRLIIK